MNTSRRKLKVKIWILILSYAILTSLPFLVPHLGPLSLIAFVPLFYLEKICTDNNIKYAWWYYYAAFLLFNIVSTFWIWFVSAIGCVAALLLNALQMTVIFALFHWSRKRLKTKWLSYVFFIITWIAWEHVYFNIELSWPWLVLGNSFATSTKLVQWYELTGTLGGSLWILLVNVLIYFLLLPSFERSSRKKKETVAISAAVLLLIVVPVAGSLCRYSSYRETEDSIEAVAVQPNIDPFKKYGILPQNQLDDNLIAQIESVITPQTRYVITPETFSYGMVLDNPASSESFRKYKHFLAEHPGTNLLVGILTYGRYFSTEKPTPSARPNGQFWYDAYNSAVLMDESMVYEYYHKSKLVPGVEIIPYQQYIPFLGEIVSKFGGSSGSYGTQDDMTVLTGNDGNKVGAMICYESIYGEYSRRAAKKGATFMAVMTNDGWWGDTPGYRQHFRYASLRAIEMRRDVVHVANTGISGHINQRGDVLQRTQWWVPAVLKMDVNVNSKLTPFVKYGDIVGLVAAYLFLPALLAMIVVAIIGKKRKLRS